LFFHGSIILPASVPVFLIIPKKRPLVYENLRRYKSGAFVTLDHKTI